MVFCKNHAAVVVLKEELTSCLLLTRRASHLNTHPGEMCFPGGHWQPGDIDLLSTATRELSEELGMTTERMKLLKALQPVVTLRKITIYPWLMSITEMPSMVLNRNEVDVLIKIPWEQVIQSENYQPFQFDYAGELYTSLQFVYQEAFIWGATAKIMQQLTQ